MDFLLRSSEHMLTQMDSADISSDTAFLKIQCFFTLYFSVSLLLVCNSHKENTEKESYINMPRR